MPSNEIKILDSDESTVSPLVLKPGGDQVLWRCDPKTVAVADLDQHQRELCKARMLNQPLGKEKLWLMSRVDFDP
jgi:hypothetical protein